MVMILDLPIEVVGNIIQACLGTDLECLAFTNKLLYRLAKKDLEKHKVLQRKYSVLRFGCFDREGECSVDGSLDHPQDSFQMLSDIIRLPDVADYPRTIYLADVNDDDRWDPPEDIQEIDQEMITADESTGKIPFDALLTMIHKCGFIPENQKLGIFNGIQRGTRPSAAINLLLTLLPNLTSVLAQGWAHSLSSERICGFVQQIAEANRESESPLHNKALAKLQSFTVCDSQNDSEHMDEFGPFAMLPSMRTLSAPRMASEYFDWPKGFSLGYSCVTVIDFTGAALDSHCLTELLSGIMALEIFKYSHNFCSPETRYNDFCLREIIEVLEYRAASSLHSLDISAENPAPLLEREDHEKHIEALQEFEFLDNLRNFSSLEFIRIETDALHKHSEEWPDSYEDAISMRRRVYTAVETQDANDEVQDDNEDFQGTDGLINLRPGLEALTNILPSSVKILTLIHSWITEEAMLDLLEDLREDKDNDFPALVGIDFEGATLSEEAKVALMEIDIDFREVARST